jgi:hypothetical protein
VIVVYVETNFILELTFLQEEHEQCRSLLRLAVQETGIELALPAFCVAEAYEAFERKRRHRLELADRLRGELGQLARSKTYAARRKDFVELTDLFRRSGEEQQRRLDRVLDEVLGVTRLLPLERMTTRKAVEYRKTRDLGTQDALVYASVIEDLDAKKPPRSCFITRNPKDFANPDIRDGDLADRGCTLLTNFTAGVGHVRAAGDAGR